MFQDLIQWSLFYSQCSKEKNKNRKSSNSSAKVRCTHTYIQPAHIHTHVYTDKVTVSESEQNRQREKQGERERRVTSTVWWWLTQKFTVRSGYAVKAGAGGTGQALCAGALSLPRSLSSLLHSHTAPAAPPAVRQSDCEGVAAQRGYIKGPERWEAQGLMLAHNKVSHKRETEREQRRTVLKKQSKLTPSQRRASAEQNISFSSPNQHYASFASNNSDEILFPPRSLFSLPLVSFFQRLQPMAPLSVWTREII